MTVPSDISGLVCWYKADSILGLTDGDGVALWADSSSNSIDVAQADSAQQPIWNSNKRNSLPAVSSAGTQILSAADVSPLDITALTLIYVFRYNGMGVLENIILCKAGDTSADVGEYDCTIAFDGNFHNGLLLGGSLKQGSSNYDSSLWHYMVATYDGTDWALFTDFAADGSGTDAGLVAATAGPLTLFGADINSATPRAGIDLAEVALWDRALDSTERGQMDAYFGVKWGFTSADVTATLGAIELPLDAVAPTLSLSSSATITLGAIELPLDAVAPAFTHGAQTITLGVCTLTLMSPPVTISKTVNPEPGDFGMGQIASPASAMLADAFNDWYAAQTAADLRLGLYATNIRPDPNRPLADYIQPTAVGLTAQTLGAKLTLASTSTGILAPFLPTVFQLGETIVSPITIYGYLIYVDGADDVVAAAGFADPVLFTTIEQFVYISPQIEVLSGYTPVS